MRRFLRCPWRWAVAWWASSLLLLSLMAVRPVAAQFDGGTLQRATISYNTSGDKTLVAAVAGKAVRVFQWFIVCNGANNLILKDSAAATLQPIVALAAGGAWVLDYNPGMVWYQTATGTGLVLNLSASQQCSGTFIYTQG